MRKLFCGMLSEQALNVIIVYEMKKEHNSINRKH